ncbi:MAG: ABC transporter permease [Polyangiales bacterium]
MRALSHKLRRDVWQLRGQAITIALVVASGIATYVTLRGAYVSLQRARAQYYAQQRFGDLFVHLERAPEALATQLEHIPGVAAVQSRIVSPAMIPLESAAEPIRAQVVSMPHGSQPAINRVELVEGRLLDPTRDNEGLLLESFARAQRIHVGEVIPAVLNGKKRSLRVVGIVRSPEYVFAIAAGELAPDPARFAVLFLTRKALETTFRMEGAFNDASLMLDKDAIPRAVLEAVDRTLAPYGGLGAYLRDKQASNYAISGELDQLRGMSTVLPLIFVLVAALLVNVVLSRLVHLQRPEIATLKALGYGDLAIGAHFLQLVLLVVSSGALIGVGLGLYLGRQMVGLYARFFKFPDMSLSLDGPGVATTVLFCAGAAVIGALSAVRSATRLPPAEAMRPPAPARFRQSLLDRLGLSRWIGLGAQMVFREIERRPWRTFFSTLALAASVGLMIIGAWYYDSIDDLMRTQFRVAMREDVTVAFTEPRPARSISELAHLPGVLQAEGLRTVPVRFRVGHRARDGVLIGYPRSSQLRSLRDKLARPVPLPADGVMLTDMLASLLELRPGQDVVIELREGLRRTHALRVTGLVSESFGLQGHMDLDALQRFVGEQDRRSVGLLRIDPVSREQLQRRLKDLPYVVSVTRRDNLMARFKAQSGTMITTVSLIIIVFAATITVGVVYNNARVALSTRARDLASLRVLGFTRAEISSILLTEMSVPVVLALVPGFYLGHWFVELLASLADPETYRLPVVIQSRAYAAAALVALVAAACSALLVRRRLDGLDLIGVLKTRE